MSSDLFSVWRLMLNTKALIVSDRWLMQCFFKADGKMMSQESSEVNLRVESAKNAILERLKSLNLTLDDLLAAKAYAEIMKCESIINDDMRIAEERLKVFEKLQIVDFPEFSRHLIMSKILVLGRFCELNNRILASSPHRESGGVLLEYDIIL